MSPAGAGGHRRATSPSRAAAASAEGCREPAHRRRPVIDLHRRPQDLRPGRGRVRALAGVDLRVERGDYVAIMGASGSGKSTLMNIIGCLDVAPPGATCSTASTSAGSTRRQLSLIRNRKIGFVFQSFNLIAADHRAAQRRAAAGLRRRQGRRRAPRAVGRARPGRARRPGAATSRPSCPAASSSGSRSPGRSSPSRSCCWPTSPPARWTATAPPRCCDLFDELAAGGRTLVVITHEDEVAAHAKTGGPDERRPDRLRRAAGGSRPPPRGGPPGPERSAA